MLKSSILKSAKSLLYTTLILFSMGCKESPINPPKNNNSVSNDSLSKSISKSRNPKLNYKLRKKLILKSLDIIENVDNDSLKSKYLSKLSWASYTLKDSALFRKINSKTISFSKTIQDSIALAESNWDLGVFLKENGIPDSSFYHFRESQKIYKNLRDSKNSAELLREIASLQLDVGDNTGAEITAIQALEIMKPLNNDKALCDVYNLLGIIAKQLKDYEKSIEYYDKSQEHSKNLKNKNALKNVYLNNIGVLYQEQGRYKDAIQNFKNVIAVDSISFSDLSLYAKAITNLAHSKIKIGDTVGVYNLLKESIRIKNNLKDNESAAASHYYASEYFLYKKDTLKALEFANKAKETAVASKNNKRLLKTWQLLGKLEPENAVIYTQNYIFLSDSLQQVERQVRNKFARIRFETEETEAENLLLAQQRQMWIGIAAALFALAFSIFIIISQRVKNQRLKFERKQQESNQEIFNLLLAQGEKLEEGKKSEQKRISEELHDSVIGQIMGSRLILSSLNKKNDLEAVGKRAEIIDQLKDVEAEVRTISHELSDAAYQKIYNFTSAVQELLDRINDSAKIECLFNYDSSLDWDTLKGNQKINIYRIVQESLQNSVKHAACSTIIIDFKKENENIIILITDNGKGFNPKKGKKGIGLKNIISRVEKINGTLDVTSEIGKGTTIGLEIPLNESLQKEKQITSLAKGA